MSDCAFVITCEHAGNRVPAEYRALFAPHAACLLSHRGWDPGALQLAESLSRALEAPLLTTPVTRLLVETNRSLRHPRLFSSVTRSLPRPERERIVERWWRPLRDGTVRAVQAMNGPVVHVSAHSFTPSLDGRARAVDVGFLYDPSRAWERELVGRWQRALQARRPDLRVRRNAPYRGTADGHTTALRQTFPPQRYAGIEIEVNQAIIQREASGWRQLRRELAEVLLDASTALRGR